MKRTMIGIYIAILTFAIVGQEFPPKVAPNMCLSLNQPIKGSSNTWNIQNLNDGFDSSGWSGNGPFWVAMRVNAESVDAEYLMLNFRSETFENCFFNEKSLQEFNIVGSANSTDGQNGDWDTIKTVNNKYRDAVVVFNNTHPRWIRIEAKTKSTVSLSRLDVFRAPPKGYRNDYWIFLGASITQGDIRAGFFDNTHKVYFSDFIRKKYPGYYPIVINSGYAGELANIGVNRLKDNIIPDNPKATFFAIHHGGNNVSGGRPYPGGKSVLLDAITDLIKYTLANNYYPILSRLTFRNYSNVDWPKDSASEYNGSLPYNIHIHDSLCKQLTPYAFNTSTNLPYVDPYTWFRAHQEELSDGVHHTRDGRNSFTRIWAEAAGKIVYDKQTASSTTRKILQSKNRYQIVQRGKVLIVKNTATRFPNIQIVDPRGRIMLTTTLDNTSLVTRIDLTSLTPGMYFVKTENQLSGTVKKVMIGQ